MIVRMLAVLLTMSRVSIFDRVERTFSTSFRQTSPDLFVLSFLVVLIVGSVILIGRLAVLGVSLIAGVAIYRVLDIVTRHLHTMFVTRRPPEDPGRTLVIAFLNFVQLAFCFGIIYYWLERVSCGAFTVVGSGRDFRIGEALYLSFMVITTIGFADIYPQTFWAKSLSVIEVLVGIVLLVFIVARHMSYYAKSSVN